MADKDIGIREIVTTDEMMERWGAACKEGNWLSGGPPAVPKCNQVYRDVLTGVMYRFDGDVWIAMRPQGSGWPRNGEPDEVPGAAEELASEIARTCPWCGFLAESLEALAIHDETCE